MNQIKQGYKQTKVGVIPEDWEVVKLKDIAERVTRKNSINCTNVLTISAQYGLINQEKFFNKSVASKDLSRYILLNKGEFAYNKSYSNGYPMGAIKKLNLYEKGVLSSLYIYFKLKNVSIDFYEHYFEAGLLNKEISNIAQEGARNHGLLNIGIEEFFSDIFLKHPPLKEQEKIAEILTTWDEAITKQTELIEAKELQKKGLMQKLLSGEVRFSGFSDEWEEVRLGEIGSSFNGLSGKTGEDFGIGEAKYITYKNIFDNSKIKLDIFENVQISDDEKQNLVKFGDIFFTVSSETPEEVGMSSVLLDNVANTYLNSFCFGYRLNSFDTLDPYFSRFYFRSFQMRDKISRLAQGSTRFNLSKNGIMKLKIKLPPLPEQQKIAEVLSLSDDEIKLLKNKLDELKLQKKALMQKLLTGKVRVRV
jgi:type I restriction enzyme S subunit